MKKITLAIVSLLYLSIGFAQNGKLPILQKSNDHSIQNKSDGLIFFENSKNYSPQRPMQVLKDVYKLPTTISFRLIKEESDKLGFVHQKYQEYYNGVKVEFGTVMFHSQENRVKSLSSEYYPISEINVSPTISKTQGFQRALSIVGAQHYLWENPEMAKMVDNYKKPEGELVIVPVFFNKDGTDKTTTELKLAYKYDIYATEPVSRGNLYIDAKTGERLFYDAIIKHANDMGFEGEAKATVETETDYCEHAENENYPMLATATAATRYSGTRNIITRKISTTFRLRDDTRGGGVNTYNSGRQTSYPKTDFKDADNNWTATEFNNTNKDNAALDAHWGAEQTYDYWLNVHGRNSFDGAGAALNSWVHYDDVPGNPGYNNAFWNGSFMTYGDGSCGASEGCGGFDALTSIDVAAHEIGHAITERTAALAYRRESGAMNEGFSDIWGASVEQYAKGNGNDLAPAAKIWLIGDEIDRRGGSAALRSMSNPKSLGQPDTYKGQYWQDASNNCTPNPDTNDNCGVHTNSGVLNHWFYLTVAGGNGTNDIGSAYNVAGIGMMKAQAIAYRTELLYLTANSKYADARIGSIQAAKDLYGNCSIEEQAVTNAWFGVGVGAAFVNSCVPSIGFKNVTGNKLEGTDCGYTDVNILLSIGLSPSQDATVTFSVAGGTATEGTDFTILTPSITFSAGSEFDQNLTLRIFNDGFVESDETAVIDFTVDANGGDASADTTSDSLTYTIINDDAAPTSTENIVLITEDFTDFTDWLITDRDGDGNSWLPLSFSSGGVTGLDGNFAASETNLSLLGGFGKANADNYLISPQITIPNLTTNVAFKFTVDGFSTKEHYKLSWTTDISTYASVDAGITIEERNATKDVGDIRTVNNTNISNQTGYFVIRHYNSSANNGLLLFDNLSVTATVTKAVQTAVNSGTTNDQIGLGGNGTIYTSDASSGKVMLDITNSDAHNYGCTDVSVSRSGTGAQAFNGSSAPNLVMDKNYKITVDNATVSGDISIKFYFTQSEISGWQTATGLNVTDLVAARVNNSIVTETAPLTVGSFGSNVTLTGSFTGIEGTYVFGPSATFSDCSGIVKTWTGTSWSPAGAPDSSNPVIISGDYNTLDDGSLNACTLIVNVDKTLTVGANSYVNVNSNITVNGTLFVAHEGSLVQVDDDATVTNNGSITVRKITPTLAEKTFMVLGSPMTAETRAGVYGNSFILRNYITENFVPNPEVESEYPGTENFADDNGDDWVDYTGTISAGEGYLVFPQPNSTTSGSYTLDYTLGTLNNGEVDFNVIYNGTQNSSPNVVGNPYASAIDANAFMAENTMVNTVYFWEHLTAPNVNYPGYLTANFDMGDISMYNSLGGVHAANDTNPFPTTPDGYIASGQGFGFKATVAGTAKFNNAMRVTDHNDTYRRTVADRNRIWINISNETYSLGSGMLVSFSDESVDGYDARFDAKRLATPVSLYSILDSGEELAIQGRSAFNFEQEIHLGFVSQVEANEEYKISISDQDGIAWTDVNVYLLDNVENVIHNLSTSDYVFTSMDGIYNDRFVLFFESTVLGNSEIQLQNITLVPNPTTGILSIISPKTAVNSVEVYDIRGRKLMEVQYSNNQYILDLSGLQSATYFVKINSPEGSLTKRVIKQ